MRILKSMDPLKLKFFLQINPQKVLPPGSRVRKLVIHLIKSDHFD